MGIAGGRARIDHVVAAGSSFTDATYRRRPQSQARKQTLVDLHARPTARYAPGYGLPLGDNTQIAVGMEYEGETGDRAVSTHLRMSF